MKSSTPTKAIECHHGLAQYVKYMGSKTKILDFVVKGLNEVYNGNGVCDLFAGSCTLAGAIGDSVPVWSNDIQHYSATLGAAYLLDWRDTENEISAEGLIANAMNRREELFTSVGSDYSYELTEDLDSFWEVENLNRQLIDIEFQGEWHLFTKYYSGTWWSAEQCTWIDSLRMVIEAHREHPLYHIMLASLMHAMAYTSQGTGHYAQYRDAKTPSSLKDILIYRTREFLPYFEKKFNQILKAIRTVPPSHNHRVTALDFEDCLAELNNTTVYADPPYCFVHYSRFYHALETLVLYDYPSIQYKGGEMVKGRYREERHQSPFCIKTKVPLAFKSLFDGINNSSSNLVLSYSNTGMISLDELLLLAKQCLPNYEIETETEDHIHMTMGRSKDRTRDVKELLILAKRR